MPRGMGSPERGMYDPSKKKENEASFKVMNEALERQAKEAEQAAKQWDDYRQTLLDSGKLHPEGKWIKDEALTKEQKIYVLEQQQALAEAAEGIDESELAAINNANEAEDLTTEEVVKGPELKATPIVAPDKWKKSSRKSVGVQTIRRPIEPDTGFEPPMDLTKEPANLRAAAERRNLGSAGADKARREWIASRDWRGDEINSEADEEAGTYFTGQQLEVVFGGETKAEKVTVKAVGDEYLLITAEGSKQPKDMDNSDLVREGYAVRVTKDQLNSMRQTKAA